GARGSGAAQGDPCSGGSRGGADQGNAGGGQAGGAAPGEGGRAAAGGGSGDAVVHELPARALDASAHEQSVGAVEPGDQAADAGSGDVPRRRVGADAGGGAAALRGGDEVGDAPLPEHGQVAGRRDGEWSSGSIVSIRLRSAHLLWPDLNGVRAARGAAAGNVRNRLDATQALACRLVAKRVHGQRARAMRPAQQVGGFEVHSYGQT